MSSQKLRIVTQGEFAKWLLETMQREMLTVRAVATALNVTPKSVYEWLRGKGPLHPDHVRAELLQRIEGGEKSQTRPRESLLKQIEDQSRRLQESLVSGSAPERVAALPPAYRDRYQARVKEITLWARRELDEYLKVLEADFRAAQNRKPR